MKQLYRYACDFGEWIACSNLGTVFLGWFGDPIDPDSAKYYFELACRGHRQDEDLWIGTGFGCNQLGDVLVSGKVFPADTVQALEWYSRGCSLFHADSCADFAHYGFLLQRVPNHIALLRAATACEEGSGYGCSITGWLYQQDALRDQERAILYLRRSCEFDHAWGCNQLGRVFENEFNDSLNQAVKYYRRACDLKDGYGCRNLGVLLETQLGAFDPALNYYRRACYAHHAEGCWRAMQLYRSAENHIEEAIFRSRACQLSADYCKKKALLQDENSVHFSSTGEWPLEYAGHGGGGKYRVPAHFPHENQTLL